MKWLIYFRMAMIAIRLIRALFKEGADEKSRESAIEVALRETGEVLPKTKPVFEKMTEVDANDLALIAGILSAWEPE